MKMELKNAIIGAILTFLVTAILQYFFLFFFGDDGKIELISNKLNDNSYQTIIALKNMSSDEYLKNIEIKLKDDIEIISLDIDGKSTENFSVINFEDVVPTATSEPFSIKTHFLPILVVLSPQAAPLWIVTFSFIIVPSPSTTFVASPL